MREIESLTQIPLLPPRWRCASPAPGPYLFLDITALKHAAGPESRFW